MIYPGPALIASSVWLRFRRRFARGFACAVLCLAVDGVGAVTPPPATDLRVQLKWHHQFQFAGYYMAESLGYYREAGLNVTLLEAPADGDTLTPVLSGRAELGIYDSSLLALRSRGEPVVALAAIEQHSPMAILVPEGYGLNTIADLKGQPVMFEPGDEIWALLRVYGLRRPEVIERPLSFDPVARLRTDVRAISAYVTTEPFLLEQAGMPYKVFTPQAVGIDFYGDVLYTTEAELAKQAEPIRRFVEASRRGWRAALQTPAAAIDLILARAPLGHSRASLEFEAAALRRLIQPELVEIGYMSPHRWAEIAATYRQVGVTITDEALASLLWVENPLSSLRPWFIGSGIALGLALAASLISLRLARRNRQLRRAVTERETAEVRLRTLTGGLEDAIWEADADLRITFVNAAAPYLLGVPAAGLLGHPLTDFFRPEDAAAFADARTHPANPVSPGRKLRGKPIAVRQDHTLELVFYRNDHGHRAPTFSGVLRDITARLDTDERLAFLREAIDQSGDSIALTDLDATILYVNQGFVRVSGYSREELLGGNPRVLKSGIHDRAFYADMWRTLRAGDIWEGEICNRAKNGNFYWDHVRILPVRDSQHVVVRFMVVRNNISLIKKTAEALRASEAELRVAKEAAEAANRAQSVFLAMMSHELRTPLNGILGFTQLLEGTRLTPGQLESVQAVRASGDSLMMLVNDLLDYAKIEAGKMTMEVRPFCLADCTQAAIDSVRVRAGQKGLALDVILADCLPASVQGDPTRLRQVLINLLGNAVKFTAVGSVTLRLASAGADTVRIEIIDTGIGIPPSHIGHLFQLFSQADASVTREYGGTGLGLAISKQLTELMGGRIGVDSTAGRGATFWLELPLPAATAPMETKSGTAAAGPLRLSLVARRLRVLVAEDNLINQLLISRLLEALGLEIPAVVASNGQEVVAHWAAGEFDVIFMDCQMPLLDGYQATLAIREKERYHGTRRRTKIIALTADTLSEDRARTVAVGMDAYLSKPIFPELLLDSLEASTPRQLV